MVTRTQVGVGVTSALLMAGSLLRIVTWARSKDGRSFLVGCQYADGVPRWTLELFDCDESLYSGQADSLQSVIVLAVNALGKSL